VPALLPFLLASIALAAEVRTAGDCANCRVDGARTVLCAAHGEAERSTLRIQSAAYAQKTEVEARIACLEAVARLTAEHANAPSPAVARFVASGLGARAIRERRRALELLDGQHRDETVQGLVGGWREAQKAWRVIDAKLVLSESREEKPTVALTSEDLVEAPEYLVELIRAVGRTRDEKLLPAVRDMLRMPLDRTPGSFVVAAAETALSMHCRKAVEGVLDLLEELETASAEGRLIQRFANSTGLLSIYKGNLENAGESERTRIAEALARYAATRELSPPPPEQRGSVATWRAWYKTAREKIPERPGA
jgi:hypothetical protein